MRVKPWLALALVGVLTMGVLMLSACSGGSSSTADQESAATDTTVAVDNTTPVTDDQEPASEPVDEAPVEETEPEPADDAEPVEEEAAETTSDDAPPPEEIAEQPLLTWGRDAGGNNHCDHMSIFPDGSVEAVVCRAGSSEPMVYGALTDEQLSQVTTWVAEYSTFTRREMEMSRAVRTTTLHGTGSVVPETETKKEIAAFAAELYFELTETE